MHRGKLYVVSCRQLGVPETKEASWRAANEWWEQQQGIADLRPKTTGWPGPSRSAAGAGFLQAGRGRPPKAVEALLGAGSYQSLKSQAGPCWPAWNAAARTHRRGPGRSVEDAAPRRVPVRADERRPVRRLLPEHRQLRRLDRAGDRHRRHRRGEAGRVLQPPVRQGRRRRILARPTPTRC